MNDLTRREFINGAAGAAGSVLIGPKRFLNATAAQAAFAGFDFPVHPMGPIPPIDSVIFPKPQEIVGLNSDLILDKRVNILVPANATEHDLFLARSLANELGDRFNLHLKIERAGRVGAGARSILMGSIQNNLIREYRAQTLSNQNSVRGDSQVSCSRPSQ